MVIDCGALGPPSCLHLGRILRVSNAQLGALIGKNLTSLKTLDLDATRVTDEGLPNLASLASLRLAAAPHGHDR